MSVKEKKTKMKKKIKKRKVKKDKKLYGHIAVDDETTKQRFEKLRFKLTGEMEKEVTQDKLVNILLDNYEDEK